MKSILSRMLALVLCLMLSLSVVGFALAEEAAAEGEATSPVASLLGAFLPMILIVGRLCVRNWRDKDGYKRRNTEVRVEQVYFGEAKRRETERADQEQVPAWVQAADALTEYADSLLGETS